MATAKMNDFRRMFVVARMIPVDLLAQERKIVYERRKVAIRSAEEEARALTIRQW